MFTEHAVGFIPKYTLPFGRKFRESIEDDRAIDAMNTIIEACNFILNDSSFDISVKNHFKDIYTDMNEYSDYLKRNPSDNKEDLFLNINLVLEDFYEACDMFRIKLAS